jgi:hypothetical protein
LTSRSPLPRSRHHPLARAVWHYRAIVSHRKPSILSQLESRLLLTRLAGQGKRARGRPPRAVLFLAGLAGTAFQQELPTAKTVLIKFPCPLHDAGPPPPHHSNDGPGARLLFRCRTYRGSAVPHGEDSRRLMGTLDVAGWPEFDILFFIILVASSAAIWFGL